MAFRDDAAGRTVGEVDKPASSRHPRKEGAPREPTGTDQSKGPGGEVPGSGCPRGRGQPRPDAGDRNSRSGCHQGGCQFSPALTVDENGIPGGLGRLDRPPARAAP